MEKRAEMGKESVSPPRQEQSGQRGSALGLLVPSLYTPARVHGPGWRLEVGKVESVKLAGQL